MAAVLTSTGINFSDGTSASGRSSFSFPSGTRSFFFRSTAPTGWTTVAQNNKMLRVVSGTGGGSGGTNSFTAALATRPVSVNVPVTITFAAGPVTLDTNQIPSHNHPTNNSNANIPSGPGANVTIVNPGNATGNYGNGGAHTHPVPYTANGPFSSSLDMRVQYCDVIVCQFSG